MTTRSPSNHQRRRTPQVDFSYNAWPAADVVEVIESASDRLYAAAGPQELFLQLRQFSRRFKSRYGSINKEWMVQRREIRTHIDKVGWMHVCKRVNM